MIPSEAPERTEPPSLGAFMRKAFASGPAPNFFIVGAPKCGTTSLAATLSLHPEVFMSNPKEPHAFGSDLQFLRDRTPPDEYVRLFKDVDGERAVGEASVWYLRSQRAPREIWDFNPEARILVLLRNPVDVLHSLHAQALRNGVEHIRDFRAALEAEPDRRRTVKRGGRYARLLLYSEAVGFASQLQRYLERFGSEQVEVVLLDDLVADPSSVLSRVQGFLRIEQRSNVRLLHRNKGRRVRSVWLQHVSHESLALRRVSRLFLPDSTRVRVAKRALGVVDRINTVPQVRDPIDERLRAELCDRFAPEVDRLSQLLGRDLTHWSSVRRAKLD
jgi:hypothetical protein